MKGLAGGVSHRALLQGALGLIEGLPQLTSLYLDKSSQGLGNASARQQALLS
ncbi:MAG: hypothetical protein JZD41_09575 [Thermoproteus sp.]|nr:hypothetical protein [Thermoproteus sp.]